MNEIRFYVKYGIGLCRNLAKCISWSIICSTGLQLITGESYLLFKQLGPDIGSMCEARVSAQGAHIWDDSNVLPFVVFDIQYYKGTI